MNENKMIQEVLGWFKAESDELQQEFISCPRSKLKQKSKGF